MSLQVSASFNNVNNYPTTSNEGTLTQLIENGDEKSCLNYLKSSQLNLHEWRSAGPEAKSLLRIALDNGWDGLFEFLLAKGVDIKPEIKRSISINNLDLLAKLVGHFDLRNYEMVAKPEDSFLLQSLKEKNFKAAALLLNKRASLSQKLPQTLKEKLLNEFTEEFYKNKAYFGEPGKKLLLEYLQCDFEDSLAYAIAAHYSVLEPESIELLLVDPEAITMQVLKVFIRQGNATAFCQALARYSLNIRSVDSKGADLLLYSLTFNDNPERIKIIDSILSLKPDVTNLVNRGYRTFERVENVKLKQHNQLSAQSEALFAKILDDPSRYQEIWGLQRLLINSLGVHLTFAQKNNGFDQKVNIKSGNYYSVDKHFRESLREFFKDTDFMNDWIFFGKNQHTSFEDCLKMLKEKKILKFSNSWSNGGESGHLINAVIFDKYLFICNRGDGAEENCGICIYEIQDEPTLNEMIKFFFDSKSFFENSKESKEFVVKGIPQHNGLRLLTVVKGSPQKTANCVWLSEKMGNYACFIASFIKQKGYGNETLKLARDKFKEWTAFDRLKLLNSYLDHDYHLHPRSPNVQEGILLVDTIRHVIKRTPKRLQVESYDFVKKKLFNINIQTALGPIFKTLNFELLMARFHHAFNRGDTSFISTNIKLMSNNVAKGNIGTNILNMALEMNNSTVVNELLKLGANANVGLLNPNISSSDTASYMFFHQAIKEGFVFIVKEMLNNGVDLSREVAGYAAIHTAAYSNSQEVIDLIVKGSKDLELKSKTFGMTPLHLAVSNNNLYFVKMLLEKGVNPNPVDDLGRTPLSLVTEDNQNTICELLVKHGADINCYQNRLPFLAWQILANNQSIVQAVQKTGRVNLDLETSYEKTLKELMLIAHFSTFKKRS